MTLADASFLIDYVDPQATHHAAAVEYIDGNDGPFFTSPIALYELYEGVVWTEGTDAIAAVNDDIWWAEPVDFSAEIAARAARLITALKREGKEINAADALIGATALEIGQPILARDRHFGRIDGLEVLSYR